MKILDLLRKLGILRYGTKSGTYTSNKDMPPELFMDDVYDAKKDLVHQEDLEAVARAAGPGWGRQVFFWTTVVLGVWFLILFVLGAGISSWFFLDLALWGGYLALAGLFAYGGRYSYLMMSIGFVAALLLSFFLLGMVPPRVGG